MSPAMKYIKAGILISFLMVFLANVSSQQITLVESGGGTKRPGESLHLTCTVSGFSLSSYYVNWVRQPPGKGLEWMGRIADGYSPNYNRALQNRIALTVDKSKNQVLLQVNTLKPEDSSTYYCVSLDYVYEDEDGLLINEYGFDYWGKGTFVTVTSETATAPVVFPLSPCCQDSSSASQVTMGCLVSNYFPEPATVQWNKGAISSGIKNFPAMLQSSSGHYRFSSQLTVPASSWQSQTFQCNVAHAASSSAIDKEIAACSSHEPVTPTVRLLHSSCSRRADTTIHLVCLISGFYPSTVTVNWLVDGQSGVLAANTESPKKDANGQTFSTTSTANVTQLVWKEGKKYSCQVIHESVTVQKDASACAGGDSGDCTTNGVKISITSPTPADLYMNGEPKLVCTVANLDDDSGLKVSWLWEKPGPLNPEPVEISDSDGTLTAKSSLTISKQNWLGGDIFTCRVEHPDFAAPLIKTIAKKTGKRAQPHVYLFRPHNEEMKSRDAYLSLTCLVKGFTPEDISLKWLENHSVVTEDNYVTTPVQMDSTGDSFFIYSKMRVSKADWNNGHSFTCHVVHEGLSMKYTQRTIEKLQGKK